MAYMLNYEELEQWVEELEQELADQGQALEALDRAKEDWENMFDAVSDIVIVLNDGGRISRVNVAAAKALNTKKEKLVGRKCHEVIHGREHPIEDCPLVLTKKTLKPHTKEINESNMGGSFMCSTSLILNQEGKLRGYSLTLRDVTEEKRLVRQAQHDQKMEAVGALAGAIAHEFNNLLMGIQGNASLIMADADHNNAVYEKMEKVEGYIRRGHELTKQLLGFTSGGDYEVKPTDLNELVKRSSGVFGSTREAIKMHARFQQDVWRAEVDGGQIEQVLLNIYYNAWQAMNEGGELNIETENVEFDDDYAEFFGVRRGHYVRISITDTGIGMDQATQAMIFEPFFTTKRMGAGLGLAFAYRIVQNHGGVINVYSEQGHGTTFNIYLPVSEKEVTEETDRSAEILTGTGTILMVDDESIILEVGEEMLKQMGYKVLLARGGKEAVDLYEKNKGEIDLVILDMIMPGMDGGKTYERMKELDPDVKVLLASGYSVTSQVTHILEQGCNGFIQKPFNMKRLSHKIMEILDRENE